MIFKLFFLTLELDRIDLFTNLRYCNLDLGNQDIDKSFGLMIKLNGLEKMQFLVKSHGNKATQIILIQRF